MSTGPGEQEVRTLAGQIGVEISKSRVRTPGKAGYGMYRVQGTYVAMSCGRGSIMCSRPDNCLSCDPADRRPEGRHLGGWTKYAFTLEQIEQAAIRAVNEGTPSGPGLFVLMSRAGEPEAEAEIPVCWTSAYRGSRNLGGKPVPARVRPEANSEAARAAEQAVDSLLAGDALAERETARRRQRAANAEFHREHLERRKHGLRRRHELKLSRAKRQAPVEGSSVAVSETEQPAR